MATPKHPSRRKLRGQMAIAHSLNQVVQDTVRLWRRHHLRYDQTKYVVERARRRLALEPLRTRNRTVDRLDRSEVDRLIQATYRIQSKYALMIKTLFLTGTRVDEFVHVRVEDLLLTAIHRRSTSRMPNARPIVTCRSCRRWRTNCAPTCRGGSKGSFLRVIGTPAIRPGWCNVVKDCARQAGIAKRVYPHLLRHSVATILLDSGQVPIDQVQKFLGHLHLSTTQIYAETSLRALGDNYVRALGGRR